MLAPVGISGSLSRVQEVTPKVKAHRAINMKKQKFFIVLKAFVYCKKKYNTCKFRKLNDSVSRALACLEK